jgi:ribosomal protein L12E/L44/L45/RPP1/RPP2
MRDVLPTPESPRMITLSRTFLRLPAAAAAAADDDCEEDAMATDEEEEKRTEVTHEEDRVRPLRLWLN